MDLTLPPAEIVELCGGLTQPAAQLKRLHVEGFFRARRSSTNGRVILERTHYLAVTSGAPNQEGAATHLAPGPQPNRAGFKLIYGHKGA
jgi:ribosomal protein L34